MSRPAIFLDRDGVLVEEIFYPRTGEREAPLAPEDVRLLPGVAQALRSLADAGYALVVISNQGGYAKGKATLRALWLAHERFVALLAEQGARLDGYYYSYSHPDGAVPHFSGHSLERKPGPYNIFVAAAQLDLDCRNSWMIGDRKTDIGCAIAAGLQPILISATDPPIAGADCIQLPDLSRAAQVILAS
ncbi:MAG: hisJ [Actinomycetia bacterium]|nr:hisJ [Actinomycetes bacterium]